jgi:hypothetical protein
MTFLPMTSSGTCRPRDRVPDERDDCRHKGLPCASGARDPYGQLGAREATLLVDDAQWNPDESCEARLCDCNGCACDFLRQ